MAHAAVAAKLPSTALADSDFGTWGNNAASALTADVNASQLTVPVGKLDDYPDVGIVVVDSERFLYTSKSAATGVGNLVVASNGRGWDGSTATSHTNGRTVYLAVVAYTMNRVIAELKVISNVLTGATALGHGVTINALDSEIPLSLNFNTTNTVNKFIQFKRGGTEVGYVGYDATNDELEFRDVKVTAGAGAEFRIEGGTAGAVLFLGAGGTLTTDPANFTWDDASNRLTLDKLSATTQFILPRITDPATPSIGEVWINGADLKFRNNAATPATVAITPSVRRVDAGMLLSGGGDLSEDRTIRLAAGTAQHQFVATGATPFDPGYRAINTLAGNGLTESAGVLAVGAGTLITVGADTVGLSLGSAADQLIMSGVSPFTAAYRALSAIAGAGLVTSGAAGSLVLDVGPGTLIAVGADTVGLSVAAGADQVIISGATPFTPAYKALSSLAGIGLTTSGVAGSVVIDVNQAFSPTWTGAHTFQDTVTIQRGAITVQDLLLDATVTWNAGAVVFTALKLNVTDTASAANSLLFDLQVGAASKFSVDKDGDVVLSGLVDGVDISIWNSDQFIVLAASANMANERVLVPGAGLIGTDGGAGGSFTIDVVAAAGSNLVANTNDLDWSGVTVRLDTGANVGTRPRLNFIQGTNITLTIADDGVGDEVDVTIAATAAGAPTGAQYVVMALDATLTAERALIAGAGLTLTDGGANGNVTLDVVAAAGSNLVANVNDIDWSGVTVRQDTGANIGTRPRLNFIQGANITFTIADDGVGDEIDITVAASAGTGGWTDAGTTVHLTADADSVSIGAGTTADEKFHVAKAVDGVTVAALLENSQANAAASVNETVELRFGFGGDNDVARIVAGKINDYTTAALSDSFLALYTDVDGTATEGMRLDTTGLGIGTASPASKLHVTGGGTTLALHSADANPHLLVFKKSRGTEAVPANVAVNDVLTGLSISAYTGSYFQRKAFEVVTTAVVANQSPGYQTDFYASDGNEAEQHRARITKTWGLQTRVGDPPPAAADFPANQWMTFRLTNDTTLAFYVKGSDGTVRSGTVTLA